MKQQTISGEIRFEGVGLHSGTTNEMILCPAPEGFGIRFQRTDIPGEPVIGAQADLVARTERSTVLIQGQIKVGTPEHLLAAFFGMGVDNVLVKLGGPEVPIMDGSAYPFATAIKYTGVREQKTERLCYNLKSPVYFSDKNSGTKVEVVPADSFSARVILDFDSGVLGKQEFVYDQDMDFLSAIARSRTFVFLHEVLPLLKRGLIRGGDMDNALVIADKDVNEEDLALLRTMFNKPGLKLQQGYLNDSELHFPNECARHKMMDLLGDLLLAGRRINASVTAYKPGHAANTAVALMINNQMKKNGYDT
ncbi:MAG: UDP-3-O-acyl-N-acetylglucosamine deacetylase [Bacteroidales bacterium]|jgi:UDP-3-O-[3-hydroxymyristoyl] N-acetylglucosamine deacetylase/3-hydroxyacyl-[acyl-carrier-protein] dehydratase|nr:UDP-3-O-acyl-N-acetylglucosamine deacetylase [Bacteroidales bacterium]NLH23151.1 hypothetical protein [Bacteroidales bacterium]HPJ82739.1 UDP-3-O-acyl-N-acetylglucosamine deacetylase [Bacteroidales bacterium]